MQKILALFAFVLLALPALNAQSARKVEVFFQHSHTKTDLMNIKAELAAQKILLDYTQMVFDAEGHLVELEFSVDCQDGFKGTAASSNVPDDFSFGFIRDYRQGVEVAFALGKVSKE
ncbi:MAG: hypothetical protein JNK89_06755 [Saprospiraceae bacterium]|nr:hypothetical protein [Saprospiraceae bacterium]